MKLAYKAVDRAGKTTSDSIEAADIAEASEQLRQRGLYVTDIEEDSGGGTPRTGKASRRERGGSVKELALWSRQLCVLVRSGTPLAQAMLAIESQTTEGPWRRILTGLRKQVEEGASLSDAMAARASTFDDVCRSLVAAGESSGQLGQMLDRVATLIRQQLKVRRALVGSLVYPALLVGVGVVVVNVMLLGVLPRFSELFTSMDAALPPTTKFLMAVSTALRQYWWAALGGLAAVAVAGKLFLSSGAGKALLDRLVVRLPYVGLMVRSLATARIARLLGVMLESRVPMLHALELTQTSTGNQVYGKLMKKAVDAATRGEAISTVFGKTNLINPSVTEAIRHGEKNGQIGPILMDMADFLDEENEVVVKTAMGVIEPLILIGLGIVVGFIAMSLFIPLFDLAATAGA